MPSCRGGGVTVNSFQMNSVHLTEAGSGTVERCLDSRGKMHVRNQVGKLRIDSETGATEMEVSRGLSDAVYVDVATGNMITRTRWAASASAPTRPVPSWSTCSKCLWNVGIKKKPHTGRPVKAVCGF